MGRLSATRHATQPEEARRGTGAATVWPDVQPVEAAWRLFLVHLEEAVRTAKPGETELHLDRTGVVSRAANA